MRCSECSAHSSEFDRGKSTGLGFCNLAVSRIASPSSCASSGPMQQSRPKFWRVFSASISTRRSHRVPRRCNPGYCGLPSGRPMVGPHCWQATWTVNALARSATSAGSRFLRPLSAHLSPIILRVYCEPTGQIRSGRIVARTGLRMMPTSPPSPPYHSARRVFLVTAERLACQAGPSRRVNQLKPAPGIR